MISGISENNQKFNVNVAQSSIKLEISYEDSEISSFVSVDISNLLPADIFEEIDDEGSIVRLGVIIKGELEYHYESIKPENDSDEAANSSDDEKDDDNSED